MRPARHARANASAMAEGEPEAAIAVLTSTASAPISRASAGVAGCSQPRVHQHGDNSLFNDDVNQLPGQHSLIGADGGAKRHDGRRSGFLKAFGEHGIRVNVGKHGEAFPDQDFRRFQCFNGVRHQVLGVRVNLQLDPVG